MGYNQNIWKVCTGICFVCNIIKKIKRWSDGYFILYLMTSLSKMEKDKKILQFYANM